MERQFNLIDEHWIPVVDGGKFSLKQIFSDPQIRGLGGTPIQKISVLKLLLAICQVAHTPEDFEDWNNYSSTALVEDSLKYLEEHRDKFYLHGDSPFLQIPAIEKAALKSYGAVLPEIATGNTAILQNSQVETPLDEAHKALLLIQLQNFSFSGKKTDNSVVLTPGYKGKTNDKGNPSTGRSGPALGYLGHLHSFIMGETLLDTLLLNLFTTEEIQEIGIYNAGIGSPPWEKPPAGEDCDVARDLNRSYIGRLVPLSRFVLLKEEGLHLSEGIAYSGYKEGVYDLSMAVSFQKKEPKSLWTNPNRRPWRNITSLLSFLNSEGNSGYEVYQLKYGLKKARKKYTRFILWSGGVRVSSNAGEQYCSGSDDFVDSSIIMDSEIIDNNWFAVLQQEMEELERLSSKMVYGRVLGYYKSLQSDGSKFAEQAGLEFWSLAEVYFSKLIEACFHTDKLPELRRAYAGIVLECYDRYCPRAGARQLDAWAANRPHLASYRSGRDERKAS